MNEFLEYLKKLNFKAIFFTPTQNDFIQFIRYVFVGGIATVVDWGVLYAFTQIGVYYIVSTVFGFFAGLITNFVLSKLFVFKDSEARVNSIVEFISYGVIGIVGLGLTVLIMYFFTEVCSFYYMLSKAIATVLVLLWNYIARKKFLYKNGV